MISSWSINAKFSVKHTRVVDKKKGNACKSIRTLTNQPLIFETIACVWNRLLQIGTVECDWARLTAKVKRISTCLFLVFIFLLP